MIPDNAPRETLMEPQQGTLQVVMVDDEEALCQGVRRIIERYKVHVAHVLVDAERRGISTELDADEGIELFADAGEAEIVFNNLVSDAVNYNRDGGKVSVGIRRNGDTVRIAVSDTGIGLSPEEAGKLFNEFTRIKNERTVKILGSGLGLSTVRKIANMYDGEATVKSEPGVGSTFTVTLHDAPAAAPAPIA